MKKENKMNLKYQTEFKKDMYYLYESDYGYRISKCFDGYFGEKGKCSEIKSTSTPCILFNELIGKEITFKEDISFKGRICDYKLQSTRFIGIYWYKLGDKSKGHPNFWQNINDLEFDL